MTAQTPTTRSVSTIDFTDVVEYIRNNKNDNLNLNSPAVEKVVKDIKDACSEWGFFYVVGHGIDWKLVEKVQGVMKEFFHKPTEYKRTVQRQPTNFRGFTDSELTKQKLDWKEAFDYGVDCKDKKDERIGFDPGRNQWPADMPHFRSTLQKYFFEMHSLSQTLMDLIFMSLGVEPSTMRHHFNEMSDTSYGRLNYYPVNPTGGNQFGVGPHTDPGVLAVLLQDDGLTSLQAEKDGEFYDVPPIPGSFVVNIGNLLEIWSNGLYKAPVHRVLSNPAMERFSLPYFFNPSYETDVEPVPQTISKERPSRYRLMNWGAFRQQRIKGNYADHGKEIQVTDFKIE